MRFSYSVLGAGRQGVALAYDLALRGEAARVVLADLDEGVARRAADRLRALLPGSRCAFEPVRCDLADAGAARAAMRDAKVALSAAPYRFNALLAAAAIDCGASFCDLGGNTDVVREELRLDARARARGVSIVPDCGLAPGLCNHLAAHGISLLEHPRTVRLFCGGIPERPVGPLGYKLVFSFEGLVNEYSGFGEFLRGGARVAVPALGEVESLEFHGLGRLEAAVTSGGTSTCPTTWEGRLGRYDYKTLRWPGHWAVIRAMFGLGLFEPELQLPGGGVQHPREVVRALFEQRLAFPDVADLVVLRVVVSGEAGGSPRTWTYDLRDRGDPVTGFSAMERSTAFPAALVAHLQARGEVAPGASPLERSVPAKTYFDELALHDIDVQLQESTTPG